MNANQQSNLDLLQKHKEYVRDLHAQQYNLKYIPTETKEEKEFLNKITDKVFITILKKKPELLKEKDYGQLVESYYENVAADYLSSKNIKVTKIHETNTATPDFECIFSTTDGGKKTFYIEVKTLNAIGGDSHYRKNDEETFNVEVDLEEQRKNCPHQRIYMAQRELNPWGKALNNHAEERSAVIETLIEQIGKNIKPGQFSNKPTFLLVFVNRLCNGLLHKHDLVSYYFDTDCRTVASGLLWTVCFGEKQHLILKPAIEGLSNQERRLNKTGVLVEYPYVPGIIFVDSFFNKNRRVFGLYDDLWQLYDEKWGELDTEELFYTITDAFSGKRNECIYYELYKNLKDELKE